MKVFLMCQWILEITLALCFVAVDCRGSNVSLVVEGENDKHIGPHCPGTARLVCEGVDLTFLEWKYNNESEEIVQFFLPPYTTEVMPLDNKPAFVSVQLTDLPQCSGTFCNFSSVLTVDMLQLQQQNINNISCGALENMVTIAVNVTVLQPFSSTSLNITNVTAYYSEARQLLNRIKVYWEKLTVVYQILLLGNTTTQIPTASCTIYETSIVYSVTVNSSKPFQVHHTSCGETTCEAVVTDFNTSLSDYHLTLTATEAVNVQNLTAVYPIPIGSHSKQYFLTTEINTTSCHTTVQCIPTHKQYSGQCTVQYYNADPTSVLSDPAIMHNASVVLIMLTAGTVYHFDFSLLVQEGFVVKQSQVAMTKASDISIDSREIVALVLSVLFILSTVIHCIAVLVILKVSKISAAITKKKLLLFATMLLLLLLLVCVTLLGLTLTDIIKGTCTDLNVATTQHSSVTDSMLVISCLGITFNTIIWISVGYSVCQQRERVQPRLPQLEITNHRYEQQSPLRVYSNNEVMLQDQIEKSCIENDKYEHIQLEQQMGAYDILERPTQHSMIHDVEDRPRDETYSKIEDSTLEGRRGSTYEQLRPGEKSRPVPNLSDPNYSHISKRQPDQEPDIPDILHSVRAANMRDDYDVLGRDLGRASFVSVQNSNVYNSYYDTLDEAAIEPLHGLGVYDQLRPGEKSRPVPNMEDSNYSHVHTEDEQPEVVKKRVKPKRKVFKKFK